METEEQRIIRLAAEGSTAAFEKLVQQHGLFIFNLGLRILQNPQEAEDLSQEAFLRVWKALPSFRQGSTFRTWLYRIVVNLCYDRIPKLRKELNALEPEDMFDLPDTQSSPEGNLLSNEMQSLLQKAYEQLPQQYRLLLSLRHLEGMSYDEIAGVTRLPLGTVKTSIHRGRQILKEAIRDYQNE